MRVLLVDADSKKGFPNLALMKISAHHKRLGREVDLIRGIPDTAPLEHYDQVWLSCIYFQNEDKARDYLAQFPEQTDTLFGGSGFQEVMNIRLGKEIEHLMPDYSLYDVDFSMGFTSRGCIRDCPWCIVPEKEGKIKNHAPISEFLHPDHKRLVLLDNNFLASPKYIQNLEEIIERKIKVNMNQGLDIRLVTEENAGLLVDAKLYDWHFKTRGMHFAFDTMSIESAVRRGIKTLQDAGMPTHWMMFYVLAGFNTTFGQDVYRVQTLIELGVKPYIMPYNNTRDAKVRHLARWVNRKYYEFVPFEKYKDGVLMEVAP